MSALDIATVEVPALALRLSLLRGTAAYVAYIVDVDAISQALADLRDELSLVADLEASILYVQDAHALLAQLSISSDKAVLIDAGSFASEDWATLDRQRSQLAHAELTVFVTVRDCFAELMRAAPNLASWLGAQVFANCSSGPSIDDVRQRRLKALRAWADKSDQDVIDLATRNTLPRDPEYAEWLVLLGRSDLIA